MPLERVIQCKERMSVRGEPVLDVDVENLRLDLRDLARHRPEAVAISLLNSHSNGVRCRTGSSRGAGP